VRRAHDETCGALSEGEGPARLPLGARLFHVSRRSAALDEAELVLDHGVERLEQRAKTGRFSLEVR